MIQIIYKNKAIREIKNNNFNPLAFIKEFEKEDEIFGYIVDGRVFDLHQEVDFQEGDYKVKMLTWEDIEGEKILWHSTAHVLGAALIELYKTNKLGTGPATDNGFYYDVDLEGINFDAEQLQRVENKIKEIIDRNEDFKREKVKKEEAIKYFKEQGNEYKCEIINSIDGDEVTLYSIGEFTDLCKGPHLINTGIIKNVKLTSISSAYWRGDSKNKQMTRIYGISFPSEELCEEYFMNIEKAKERNHQSLGQKLKLFTFSENVGLGLPLWLPRGEVYRKILIDTLYSQQQKYGYKHVSTPHIGHKNLYITSGHYDKYGEDSFQPIHTPNEGEEFFLKPMNCPHHCEIYRSEMHSYRDLPLRLAEFGTVYRYEQHGELHGLARTRCFTQDDAHIFCRADQVKEEIGNIVNLTIETLQKFTFTNFRIRLSFHDKNNKEKYIGNEEEWDKAEKAIQEVIEDHGGLETSIAYGEAAFYGPKIDFIVKDALERDWQLGTVQLDYQLPQKFALSFVNEKNEKETPVMIHRAPLGSIERFTAILLEHTNGNLPLWLSPEQVSIIPISNKFIKYSVEVRDILTENNIRATINTNNEQVSKKIRDAEMMKIPFMCIIGGKEEENKMVTIREHGKDGNITLKINDFIREII